MFVVVVVWLRERRERNRRNVSKKEGKKEKKRKEAIRRKPADLSGTYLSPFERDLRSMNGDDHPDSISCGAG